jgi:hypothetical protein
MSEEIRVRREALPRGERVVFETGAGALSRGAALTALRADPRFRALTLATLAASPLEAFFWETPPLTRASLAGRFEWVVLDAPALARAAPDPAPFARYLAGPAPADPVTVFANLGGDARLIVPRPLRGVAADAYGHFAAFVRRAPADQAHALLARIGAEAQAALAGSSPEASAEDPPLWINTNGAGVAWLHVRLDRTPKYYQHAPFRLWPPP